MRRWIVVVVLVLAALGSVIALAVSHSRTPAVATKTIGTWRELGVTRPTTMTITQASPGRYSVLYRRHMLVASNATLAGDHLQVWGENTLSHPLYRIRYDARRDRLVVDDRGAITTLERVSH